MKVLTVPSSGSLGGTTASHNRAGQYVRARRSPTQPVGTGRRATVRAAFGAASSAWAHLGGDVQAAWAAYADGHPYTDALGQAIKLTGHQMFVAINTTRQAQGNAISGDIPANDAVYALGAVVFTATSAGVITFTAGDSVGTADDSMLIAVSKPVSGGVSFNKTFWQIAVAGGNHVAPQVLSAAYVAQFGAPAVGQRIFYKVTPANQYGVLGVPTIAYSTVT